MSEPRTTEQPTRLGHSDFRLLCCLSENGGWTSGQLARQMGYPNVGSEAHLIRRDLLRMEALGWVGRLDEKRPVCWVRMRAGTEAMNV